MNRPKTDTIDRYKKAIINSYSQVFFSDNRIFGVLLMFVSFFDIWAGLSGLFAVVTTIVIADILGFSIFQIEKGSYSFNSLLVGLGVGLMFSPSIEVFVLLFFIAIITLLFTLMLEGFFAKYNLPFLSIPFLLGMWVVLLASRELKKSGISERGIYTANELFSIGGNNLVAVYNWINSLEIPRVLSTYFYSLGAIFFQYSLLAGFIIAIGIFLYSRIAFLLSIVGFLTAYYFYSFLGADIAQYGYTYIGFNFILTAIALGGHFVVASRKSFLWVLLLLPIVVLFTLSLTKLLVPYQLSIYSLPFNIVVLLFLYVLKLRTFPDADLLEVPLQLNNPEKNIYYQHQVKKRSLWLNYFPISLPFYGEWKVSQAEDGAYTHKGDWRYAWDFVIVDQNEKEYKNEGDFVEDYHCYGKKIIAPASGQVVAIVDGLEDNTIGEVDLINNWGNSIVIKHGAYLFSQISHIQKGTFEVKKGDFIKKGDALALVGNSGRSPYPHIHFQLQATPSIGSKTLDYPINHYLNNKSVFASYQKPKLDNLVSNSKITPLLAKALKFIPGQVYRVEYRMGETATTEVWHVEADYYNNVYLVNKEANTYAYLFQDESVHYFLNFIGDKTSALYYFYLALYQVPFAYYQNMLVKDRIPSDVVFSKPEMLLQDFLIPFVSVYSVGYNLVYKKIDNEMFPSEIELQSEIHKTIMNKQKEFKSFSILIHSSGSLEITGTELSINVKKAKRI